MTKKSLELRGALFSLRRCCGHINYSSDFKLLGQGLKKLNADELEALNTLFEGIDIELVKIKKDAREVEKRVRWFFEELRKGEEI